MATTAAPHGAIKAGEVAPQF